MGGDFAQFYVGSTIFLRYSPTKIYDLDLNDRIFHKLLPGEKANASLPYLYSPFFILFFLPLAALPYPLAYLLWTLISIALYTIGFLVVWKTTAFIPRDLKWTVGLLALAFVPFTMYCLLGGQVSTFGFFWLTLALYFERRGQLEASGLALSLLLYKPPLLLLILLMLLVSRRLRTLVGFALGAGVLILVSLLIVGWHGIIDYIHLLSIVRAAINAKDTVYQTWMSVDAGAFFRLLCGTHLAIATILKYIFSGLVAVPLFILWWRCGSSSKAWALTLTWVLIITLYVPIYDTLMIVPGVLLTADALYSQGLRLPGTFKVLMAALFITPWFTVQMALATGFQPLTLVLAGIGIYQLKLFWRYSCEERSEQKL